MYQQITPPHNKKGEYDYAIAFVRFVATFMVLNSHMGICYAKFPALATGGAIGNALFFFISGFTLFLGKPTSFPIYYKRRISRIYPTVIAMAIVASLVWGLSQSFIGQMVHYWFVNCIMIYYAVLWVVRKYKINLWVVGIFSVLLTIAVYLSFHNFKSSLIYSNVVNRYILYLVFMIQGAWMGIHRNNLKCRWFHPFILVISVSGWYCLNYFLSSSPFQLIGIILLLGICWSLYLCFKAKFWHNWLQNSLFKTIILFCGGLCLEVYLIQFYIFTDALNFIFPLNIPLIMCAVLLAAYLLRIFGRLIAQTFDSNPYNYPALFKI